VGPLNKRLKRLIIVGVAIPVIAAIAGCTGKTVPATKVTNNSAVLNAINNCKAGQVGEIWWRYRIVGYPDYGWFNTTTTNWACGDTDQTNIPTSRPVSDLAPLQTYQFEQCGQLGPHAKATAVGCWDKDGNSVDYMSNVGGNDTTFTTSLYPVSSDPTQVNTDNPDGDSNQSKTSFACEDSATACASGVGTGWACGPFSFKKSHWYGLGSIVPGPYKAWTARIFGNFCWGTGKYRGKYKNVNVGTSSDTTYIGNGYGWLTDGVENLSGPNILNGKLSFMRDLGFHKCTPPQWSIPPLPFGVPKPCISRNDDNMKLKVTLWVDSTNHAWVNFIGTPVD